VVAPAYEIRCGQTQASADTRSAVSTPAVQPSVGSRAACWGFMPTACSKSPAVMQALFGATVPTLQDAFDTLADMVQQHLDPALLRELLGG
jgi:adenosylcobyric acid synthase